MMDYPVASILAGAAASYLLATAAAGLLARIDFPLPPPHRRLGCVDGLRGYLALSVFIHHFVTWMQISHLNGGWGKPTVNILNQLGGGAVALFFMTTGFVFYPRILLGLRENVWPAIYITRVFRIVPMIACSVAIVTAVIMWRTGNLPDLDYPVAALEWVTAWGEPTLLDYPDSGRLNAYVLWSIWCEWQFYIVGLPACALAIDIIRGRLPTWTMPCAMIAVSLALWRFRPEYPMVAYTPVFACGMIAFECQRRPWIARTLRRPAIGLIASAGMLGAASSFPTATAQALPVFAFFFACVACGNDMGGLLKTRGALVLGECSYGIYLVHGIALSVFFVDGSRLAMSLAAWQLPFATPFLAVLIVCITCATYLLVERPAIRTGAALAHHWTSRRVRVNSPEVEVAP